MEGSKRFCALVLAVKIAELNWAKRLSLFIVALLVVFLVGCKKHLSSLRSVTFVIAVVVVGT